MLTTFLLGGVAALFTEQVAVVSGYNCTDGCSIDNNYINDGYCDCSDCGDERFWTCDTCSDSSCPSICGNFELCDGSGGNSTKYFYCDNGCEIPSGYYNDSWCDCSSCEDEPDLTCSTCSGGCPNATQCGDEYAGQCLSTSSSTSSPTSRPTSSPIYSYMTTQGGFTCNDGCVISEYYQNDGYCDCSGCEDETYWTCSTCSSKGCPSSCGNYTRCDGSGSDSSGYFYCYSGCELSTSWYNDSWCDCQYCEDEPDWSCSSCGGCPGFYDCANASMSVRCNSSASDDETTTVRPFTTMTTTTPQTTPQTTIPFTTNSQSTSFICDDGCAIPLYYENDGWCDCSDCEDELYWTCGTCDTESCPSSCDAYINCDGTGPNTTTDSFYCDSGCAISSGYYNDSWCDCPDCEDEPDWTCYACGGCPNFYNCTDANECDTENVFTCDSGCNIPTSYYNNSQCDCSQCEDEPNWTCDTCGGCPGTDECGYGVYCYIRTNYTSTQIGDDDDDDDDDYTTSEAGDDDDDDDDDEYTTSEAGDDDDDDDDYTTTPGSSDAGSGSSTPMGTAATGDGESYTTTAEDSNGNPNDTGDQGATLIVWNSIVAIVIGAATAIYFAL